MGEELNLKRAPFPFCWCLFCCMLGFELSTISLMMFKRRAGLADKDEHQPNNPMSKLTVYKAQQSNFYFYVSFNHL